jgi:hypothetical protein
MARNVIVSHSHPTVDMIIGIVGLPSPLSEVPANALLAEDGTPILTEGGDYILVD